MRLENAFTIEASPEQVWTAMLDFERVVRCVPGSQLIALGQDGELEADMRVKVGPMVMRYRGSVRLVEQNASDHRAVMEAKARESAGQGTARALMTMRVKDGPPVGVSIVTELDVTGRVAQMGRGVMQDVAERIVQDFASNLQVTVTEGAADSASSNKSGC